MKLLKMLNIAGGALAVAAAGSAQGAVIATNTFDGTPSPTATHPWTSNPGDLTGASLGSVFVVSTGAFRSAGGVDAGANLTPDTSPTSPVTVSFSINTAASAVDLSSFAFRFYSTNNQGNNQAAFDRTVVFNLDIVSSSLTSIFSAPLSISATDFVAGNSGNPYAQVSFDLSSGAVLAAGSIYTFTLTSTGPGFVTFDNFEVSAVPEPAAALLGSIGVLVMLRRRRA